MPRGKEDKERAIKIKLKEDKKTASKIKFVQDPENLPLPFQADPRI